MTNEMTHDDIINKEIEEEHEFMRARIKELENKPTYPFNEAFNKQLQEENAKLKQELEMRKANEQESDEFWDGVFDKDYPFNKENAYKELADYYFFLQQIPKIYYEITGGTLSKTNYFASSVILAYRDNCERCQEKQEQENNYRKITMASKEIKLNGGTFSLSKEEHTLLREIFIEYRKQLAEEKIFNQDRVMKPFYQQAYNELINLIKKFDCYEGWMEQND